MPALSSCYVVQGIYGSCKNTYGTRTSRRRRATPRSRSRTSSRRWKRSTTTGSEKRIHIPPPRGTKLRGENHHEIAVVAPTGFEPVFESRPRFRQRRSWVI